MEVRGVVLVILNDILQRCPHCGELNINNTQAHYSGHEEKFCFNCNQNYKEVDFMLDQNFIINTIKKNNFSSESKFIAKMDKETYLNFIAEHFQIRPNLH